MDTLLYLLARGLIGALQALPLSWVARIGRVGGGLAYRLDKRHRRVTIENLTRCFAREMSQTEIQALALENFKRLGENYCCAVKTSSMTLPEVRKICEVSGLEKLSRTPASNVLGNRVVAIGHFGNFELNAILGQSIPSLRPATTYRGLRQPALNKLMQSLRGKSGCQFFERRTEAAALKAALHKGGLLLGLLSDQHAGNNGLWVPFFGEECSTSAAPALLALRYDAPLHTAVCYRTAPGRWRVEVGDEIPTKIGGHPRPIAEIALAINQAFEIAVRRDPANWFWVHKRWKARPSHQRNSAPIESREP